MEMNEPSALMDNEVPSFILDLLRYATLPEMDKGQLVKKYGELLLINGISEEKQLSVLGIELLESIGILPMHATAIMEAAKKYGKQRTKKTVAIVIQEALKGVGAFDFKNNAPPIIPLQERDDQLKKVAEIVGNNLIMKMPGPHAPQGSITGRAKTDLVVPAFVGGAGIGKTRLGYECAQHVFKSWKHLVPLPFQNAKMLYVLLDFASAYKLVDRDANLSPDKILAIRLAYAYFVEEKRWNLDFRTFFALCFEHIDLFTIEDVFQVIRADLNLMMDVPIFVLLHIDEVQTIFSFDNRYKSGSGKGIFTDLIYEACRFFGSGSLIIQPFVSGTAHHKVMASKEATMYTFELIDMPLLSLGATFKLIEHYVSLFGANPCEWMLQLGFLQLLTDMGGLPSAISYLFAECFGKDYSRGLEFFQKISSIYFTPIFFNVASLVMAKSRLEDFLIQHKRAALEILGHAIRGSSITEDPSVEEMEFNGLLFWHKVGENYYLRMPFIFVFIYNYRLRIIPPPFAGVAFYHDGKVTGEGWQMFNFMFQVFLNNFLLYENGKTSITLGEFYHKADGHEDTKNLAIKLNSLEVMFPTQGLELVHNDIVKEVDWTKCNYFLRNGTSSEFGDTILIRSPEKQTAERYFGRNIDTIIVCGNQHGMTRARISLLNKQ